MATNSKIEWTDTTWNPVVGCTMVSPGCAHCYAERMASRLRAMALADIDAGRDPGRKRHYIDAVDEHGCWTGKMIPVPEALDDPFHWKKPRRVFVNSMSDLFHEALPWSFIDRVFATMFDCQWHTFQILTKRAERACQYLSCPLTRVRIAEQCHEALKVRAPEKAALVTVADLIGEIEESWPLPNVWMGTSAENRRQWKERVSWLAQTPAAVRIISAEPLLEVIDPGCQCAECPIVNRVDGHCVNCGMAAAWRACHQVISGGESGHGARPSHPDSHRILRDACQAAGIAYFFKQWGEFAPAGMFQEIAEENTCETVLVAPDRLMLRVGKYHAGRMLDGREWNEMPRPAHA